MVLELAAAGSGGRRNLDVQSRHVVERVQSESLRLLCPELTDSFKGREPTKTLEALGEVVRIEEGSQVRAKAFVARVEEATDGRVLDRAVHAFDLAVGPRMIEFREAMVDVVLGAGEVKRVGPKALMTGDQLPKLCDRPPAMRRRELKAVVREHRMDRVRDVRDEPAQEVSRGASRRLFV